ncbi:UDP-N-acetyl-D-mannosamine dehydrogenase [Alteromonas sp. ASW11-36]|uniref:UDP-N-acetyl-D-mannosamine dehydrogenase n=1 Tax=Alteromonas arenosi TaxID=3055817 RepID=A0ABT7SVP3_9ALTE|nr:UDP-N-acetyl-D-mannosamine dehydrogenase [Alteromonas sp. ASW11-36]MDM7860238.1 UDP-N-acetyl-D-mannosamine dehydrogenase [Alteromonas sp. ASW11-36]
MKFEKVSVIGLGYIGLPTAAVIASRGIEVIGVDISENTVNTINSGKVHIVEPDLDMVVQAAVNVGKLRATLTPEPADAFLIAVPTPFKDNYEPDLTYIQSAAKAIAPVLERGNIVILESTSPVGATEKMTDWLAHERPDLTFPNTDGENADIQVAHCPERVLPGKVLEELVSNDRIIGGMTPRCSARAIELYQTFVRGDCITTNSRTAEMAKLTENSFRDVNIAFANELSLICDQLKINVWELIKLANRHPRVNILSPGPGVGGHCIAVDPWFIVHSSPDEAKMIRKAREINDSKPDYVVRQVQEAADQFKKPVIACLGLSFKADIDDLRESPALEITRKLAVEKVGEVIAVEPNISELPDSLSDEGVSLQPLEKALTKANVLLVLVDHAQFKNMATSDINTKVVVDTKGIFSVQ